MKSTFLFFTINLLSLLHIFAQTQQGNTLTGGSVGLSFTQGNDSFTPSNSSGYDSKGINYGVNASITRGKFIKENWLLGYSIGAGYNHFSSNHTGDLNSPASTIRNSNISSSANIYLRRYWSVTNQVFVYAGGGLAGSFTSSRVMSMDASYYQDTLQHTSVLRNVTNVTTTGSWQISPVGQVGILYKLSDRVATEANLSSQLFTTNSNQVNFGIVLLSGAGKRALLTGADTTFGLPQIQKGRWLVGLSANVNRTYTNQTLTYDNPIISTTSEMYSSMASVRLSAGKFVRSNRVIGGIIAYSVSKINAPNRVGAPDYGLSIGAFVRSYLGTGRLRPFIEEGVSYQFTKSATGEGVPKTISLTVSAGLAYLLGERFIMQTSLGNLSGFYNTYQSTPGGYYKSNSFSISASATTLSNFMLSYTL